MNAKLFLTIVSTAFSVFIFSQDNKKYEELINIAEKYFDKSLYLKAAQTFSLAFLSNNDLGKVKHRYKAAIAWTSANYPDSAFMQLEKIVTKGKFKAYDLLANDLSFATLHDDPRWPRLLQKVKENQDL
jgi:hypothetical protein